MKVANLSLTHGAIDRWSYLAAGVSLFTIKFAIDWTVAHLLFQRDWSPADYLAPGASLGMLIVLPHERLFYAVMVLIALPFIAAGVCLTVMRLRSLGIGVGWTVLFFVPGINFGMFAVLSVLEPRTAAPLPAAASNGPDSVAPPFASLEREAAPLAYAVEVKRSWLDRTMPVEPGIAKAVAVIVPAVIAVAATFISIYLFLQYALGLFVGVPFAIGLMSAALYSCRSPRGVKGCVGVACLSLTVYAALLLCFAFEGLGCLIMAAPLAYPVAIIGALVGAALGGRPDPLQDARRVVLVMMLFLPLFMGAERLTMDAAPVYAVTTSVEVSASPSRVWQNVIGFGEIPPPKQWIFRTGIAYPIAARITGRGVGAVRRCVFSTGAFVEPIREWDEPRLLKFAVTSNPPPMREWSPYARAHPPHLENFLVSSGGLFRLIALSSNLTRLEGTTWYSHHMWPAAYWRLWSDFIIHQIHLRVLEHVKGLSERG